MTPPPSTITFIINSNPLRAGTQSRQFPAGIRRDLAGWPHNGRGPEFHPAHRARLSDRQAHAAGTILDALKSGSLLSSLLKPASEARQLIASSSRHIAEQNPPKLFF
jgi:hypothetical protein